MGTPHPGIRTRVAVAILKQDQLLLVRQNNHPFWVLPGGTLEPGETLKQCAERELLEETNLVITADRLLYVSEFITDTRHVVDFFFLGTLVSGDITMTTDENLNELAFFDLTTVQAMRVEPQAVIKRLISGLLTSCFDTEPVYLPALPL